jgi:polysaccharide export outer membrane protein
LKSRAAYPRSLGLLLIALCGSLLGRAQSPNKDSHGISTSDVAGSPAQTMAKSGDKPDNNSFIIGNDDVLAVNVWKEPDLTRSVQVRSDGMISLPLVGELKASGKTPLQLEQDITVKLLNYIAKPAVTVIVAQVNSKKFNILGQVAKPGSYSLAMASTVMDAIATAGGLRDFAKQKTIYVLRQTPGGGESRIPFNYKDFIRGKDLGQNIKLEPHDTIVVP